MAKNVRIDDNLCVGCGLCSAVCEDVFRSDPSGRAVVVPGSDAGLSCVKEAADGCPVEAIEIVDE